MTINLSWKEFSDLRHMVYQASASTRRAGRDLGSKSLIEKADKIEETMQLIDSYIKEHENDPNDEVDNEAI